ncbi:MAG UNVERIFIED_CONTAM: leucyl aminopeptidase family protein [Rickettsiaceae bacterium]|jgi:leucyl aminopeptidase
MDSGEFAATIAFGFELASYRFDKYKTKLKAEEKLKLEDISLVSSNVPSAEKHYQEKSALLAGIFLARNLISEPPNVIYPESYANIVDEDLSILGIKVTVLGEAEMRSLGMGALLGVGQGSAKESKLVVMEYYGAKDF